MREALRLCPPAAVVGRLTESDTVVDGFLVPRGSDVLVCIYAAP